MLTEVRWEAPTPAQLDILDCITVISKSYDVQLKNDWITWWLLNSKILPGMQSSWSIPAVYLM